MRTTFEHQPSPAHKNHAADENPSDSWIRIGQSSHERLMQRALHLATLGHGRVAPNPMVGAVIARDGIILAEGYHAHYGAPHAEAAAIQTAISKGIDLNGASLYVNLEPCSHQGKTPPCTQAIIDAGIRDVYIGTPDSNPLVAGGGARLLATRGIRIHMPFMQDDAAALNRRFYTYHRRQRPYVILKWAQTLDGYIDEKPRSSNSPKWITNSIAKRLVHKWRAQEQAILVGTNTIVADNPQLTLRLWSGNPPLRITIDRKLRIPLESNIFDGSTPTLVFAGNNEQASAKAKQLKGREGLEILQVDFMKGIERVVMQELHKREIQSLIIEGGALLINNFVSRGYWDEARVFVGDHFFRTGVDAPKLPEGETVNATRIGNTILQTIYNRDTLNSAWMF